MEVSTWRAQVDRKFHSYLRDFWQMIAARERESIALMGKDAESLPWSKRSLHLHVSEHKLDLIGDNKMKTQSWMGTGASIWERVGEK